MTRQNTITWVLLMILTIIAGIISTVSMAYVVPLIMTLASLKFIGVAFGFMEMNKSNFVWKVLLLAYLFIVCGIIVLVL